jgi:hypothetical protein
MGSSAGLSESGHQERVLRSVSSDAGAGHHAGLAAACVVEMKTCVHSNLGILSSASEHNAHNQKDDQRNAKQGACLVSAKQTNPNQIVTNRRRFRQ